MNHLKITHFKCFDDVDIILNRLTVMAGANGNGKSTVIQALLYLRQTIEHCGELNTGNLQLSAINGLNVPLNGIYCLALGNSNFVLNRNYAGNILSIGLFDDKQQLIVDYEADNRDAKLWLTPREVHATESVMFPINAHEFYYLNAERVGPRINQSLQFSDFPNAGCQGENTAQLIGLEGGYFRIEGDRRFPNTESLFIQDQVNNWLDYIMKGVKIKVEISPKTLSAQILIENEFTVSDPTIATNLGFGISYLLPIIATGLIAVKGSYLIIENPEAHLHPSAQSKIGQFLAMVAKTGVNVIVETHSDHLINGLQISVANKVLPSELLTINFFSHQTGDIQPEVTPISVSERGELSSWPKGFFDQTQLDYAELFKIRKG